MAVTEVQLTVDQAAKPRRRQARGERRMTQLLEAAAQVFCSVGYTAASTNAIAREAGVSPGTLYQFFPNKEAIAVELGKRLAQQLRETHGQAFDSAHAELPLDEMLNAMLDPLIEFNCQHPVFLALMHSSEVPGQVVAEHDALHASLLARTEDLVALCCPTLSAVELTRTTTMAFAVFRAGLELILAHQGSAREAYITELKTVFSRYLAPLVAADSGP